MRPPSRKPAETPPPRMGALAKLPVFFDLAGKRAVMAGASASAAWKTELLAAAGADVHVYAEELGPEMAALFERGAASGTLTHHPRQWALDVFAGAAMALADTRSDAAAQAFFCAASAAGVPVNVIDKPEFCRFQFGAIINRSPIVVAISTAGGSPILAQAIRRRIETLLPPFLADWGRLAITLRNAVATRLERGAQRRAFWEAFSGRAFRAPPSGDETAELAALVNDTAIGTPAAQGRVTLVGAGPGDPELLTLAAVRALQSADIILFDDLVSDGVLELARREAKRMMVGKRGRRDSCAQDDINALMVKLAASGKRVVRLKCGDPMIFGRAGEEIEHIEAAGIPVDVVPGITTASAMAARFGVSLTHRDRAQSVRFITGHARDGKLPSTLDWSKLADPSTSLVFYMARGTCAEIAARLVDAGLASSTPAVAVTNVSTEEEQRWGGQLHDLVAGVASLDRTAPLVVGIGAAFERANSAGSSTTIERDIPCDLPRAAQVASRV